MKAPLFLRSVAWLLPLGLVAGFPGLSAAQPGVGEFPFQPPRVMRPATNEFDALGRSVTELLQQRGPARFAEEVSATAEDWKSISSTNVPAIDDALANFAGSAREQREDNEKSAKEFLAKADSLHLDFSKGDLNVKIVNPRFLGRGHFPTLQEQGEMIPHAQEVEIILNPGAGTNSNPEEQFKIVLRRLNRFPSGWRCAGGIQWESFPTNVADETTRRELAIMDKVQTFKGITASDDPALLKLGQTLVRFLRDRDLTNYTRDALVNSDMAWALMQRTGEKGSRDEVDKETSEGNREQIEGARALRAQSEAGGIDLKDATIDVQQVTLGRGWSAGATPSLDGLTGDQFKLTLAVKSERKAKTGVPLAGTYVLAANTVQRIAGDWRVTSEVRWFEVPDGVLDAQTTASLKFEDYVAENGTLPPGSIVPEIEFTTLAGEKKMRLSDLRGKVVVLDFWATWCGPCQGPMADLQTLRSDHDNWGDKVAIVPLSIDDTPDIVRRHVDKRGWTNTFNVWAGYGGWQSAPAKAFRLSGVPTTYLIDPQGRIVSTPRPAAMDIGGQVDDLLRAGRN